MASTGLKKNAILFGIGSTLGQASLQALRAAGYQVFGTSTNPSSISSVNLAGKVLECDFAKPDSVDRCLQLLRRLVPSWDLVVFFPGTLAPVGEFYSNPWSDWARSFQINFLAPMRIIHNLVADTSHEGEPMIITLAGAGVNSNSRGVSAYASAKLALTKATELLDAENSKITFVNIGPGWVRAPIHNEILNSKAADPQSKEETIRRFKEDDFVPPELFSNFLLWLVSQPKAVVGGRNFSVPNDSPYLERLAADLPKNPEMFKMRRFGNDWNLNTETDK